MPTFTPAQQGLYDALMKANRKHVETARKILNAYLGGSNWVDPAKLGAPVGTPAWDVIENAAHVFDKAAGRGLGGLIDLNNRDAARVALPVVDAVLAAKR